MACYMILSGEIPLSPDKFCFSVFCPENALFPGQNEANGFQSFFFRGQHLRMNELSFADCQFLLDTPEA